MLGPSARRPGQSGLFALIPLPVLLGVLLLRVFLFRTRDSLIELRNGGSGRPWPGPTSWSTMPG